MLSTVGSGSSSIQGHHSQTPCVTPGAPLGHVQAQFGFLLILQVSPFEARAKAAPVAGEQGYPAHLCHPGNQRCWQREDSGRVGSGSPDGWGGGGSCAVSMEGMRKTWIFSVFFAMNK